MLNQLKRELNLFGLALTFFSRLPCPFKLDYSAAKLNQASRYFALVGWLLGLLVTAVYWGLSQVFSVQISVWLSLGFNLLLTGCFHHDGLADMADGFGGGYSLSKKLDIMKDSRLGTYGVSMLVFALAGQFLLISELAQITGAGVIWLIPLAFALSRGLASSFIYDMTYQTLDEVSKSKPLAQQQSLPALLFSIACMLPVFLLLTLTQALILIGILLSFRSLFKAFLNRQIQGYTGDCLGAAQQLSELLVYLVLIALLQSA